MKFIDDIINFKDDIIKELHETVDYVEKFINWIFNKGDQPRTYTPPQQPQNTPQESPQPKNQPIIQTSPPQEKKPEYKITTCRVTGVNHYEDNIMRLARENSDYSYSKRELFEFGLFDEKIYKYNFPVSKFELIPEPDNPYDNKAIKVIADGELVGYIKSGSCSRILNILKADKIYKIEGEIDGGKYKYLYDNRSDDDMMDDKFVASDLELEQNSYPIHVTIEIWEYTE